MNDNCIEKKNALMYKTIIELVWFLYPKEMLHGSILKEETYATTGS